ncbi:MAG TPA: Rid family detoxifying hydrolase [Gemmatimonadaceae bacterium]|nr:Rid family detoxifying hydrolase [Gemmatimonadaceae bacterium]
MQLSTLNSGGSMRRVLPLVLLMLAACATSQPRVEFLARPGAGGPFSEAVRVGDLLFLSGVIGADSTGKLASGGIGAETQQALENVKAVLARNGLTMDRVVKCTAMLADISEWAAMNRVYATYFTGPKPARSAFAASGLVLGARMELECIAAAR